MMKGARDGRTFLVIGDSHSDPNVSNARYTWLGKFAARIRPDVIVNIGDWADMPSLSKYDMGGKSYEGRRYRKDIDHAVDARKKFHRELDRARNYDPELHEIEGNHENRITKAAEADPKLDGLISTADLKAAEFGWKVHGFLSPAILDNIAFSHYFTSGVMGRPIGGANIGASLLRHGFMSCVQGHNHLFDYAERTRVDGTKIFGMSVGCYFEHHMDWAGPANAMYWRGVVLIHGVRDGYGEVEKVSLDRIKSKYGD